MSQKKIWEELASPWKTYRVKPVQEVIEFLKKQKGNILDLCCGSGRNFTKIKGIIYAIDFSKNMLKFAKKYAKEKNINIKTIQAQAYNLPFKNNFFNSAIFIASLHCITTEKKREKAVRELFRTLKPKAQALITVWDKDQKRFKNSPKEAYISWKKGGKKFLRYYYLYDKNEIIDLFKKIGFKIIKVYDKKTEDSHYSKRNIILIVKKPAL